MTIFIVKLVVRWMGWRVISTSSSIMFVANKHGKFGNYPSTDWWHFQDGEHVAYVRALGQLMDIEEKNKND